MKEIRSKITYAGEFDKFPELLLLLRVSWEPSLEQPMLGVIIEVKGNRWSQGKQLESRETSVVKGNNWSQGRRLKLRGTTVVMRNGRFQE